MRAGRYVTLTGGIVAHQRDDDFTFRDDTGDIRVAVQSGIWQGREVTPSTHAPIPAEVDRGFSGRCIWVKSLEVLP